MRKYLLALISSVCVIATSVQANDFFFEVDYLYWNATQSNMTYAITTNNLDTLSTIHSKNQGDSWASGVRLSGAYYLPCCWDLNLAWTHFSNTSTSSVSGPIIIANQLLRAGDDAVVGGSRLGRGPAKSLWKIHVDMLDLDLGFDLVDNCCAYLRPCFGVKGGRIDQNQLINYDNFLNQGTQERVDGQANQKNNFWGVGPRAGFRGYYPLGCGWSINGDCAFATLWGRHTSPTTLSITEDGTTSPFRLCQKKYRVIPQLQMLVGLKWCTGWCDCYTLSIAAGYEVQYFWNTWRLQNSVIQDIFVNDVGYGDLALHGLTVQFALGF